MLVAHVVQEAPSRPRQTWIPPDTRTANCRDVQKAPFGQRPLCSSLLKPCQTCHTRGDTSYLEVPRKFHGAWRNSGPTRSSRLQMCLWLAPWYYSIISSDVISPEGTTLALHKDLEALKMKLLSVSAHTVPQFSLLSHRSSLRMKGPSERVVVVVLLISWLVF